MVVACLALSRLGAVAAMINTNLRGTRFVCIDCTEASDTDDFYQMRPWHMLSASREQRS